MMMSPKRIYKIVLLGNSGVGKTSLMNRYVDKKFTQHYSSTIGADFRVRDCQINGHIVTAHIWDTAGQERFRSLGPAFYRGADICMFVYDVTDRKSLQEMEEWKKDFVTQCNLDEDTTTFPFVALGNKTDLEILRRVSEKESEDFCNRIGISSVFETSAKDATNVQNAFQKGIQLAMSLDQDNIVYDPNLILVYDSRTEADCCI